MPMQLSYSIAPSGLAKCKDTNCKEPIDKGTIRIAKTVEEVANFGGNSLTSYYHPNCFFTSQMVRARAWELEGPDKIEDFNKVLNEEEKAEMWNLFNEGSEMRYAAQEMAKKRKRKVRKTKEIEPSDQPAEHNNTGALTNTTVIETDHHDGDDEAGNEFEYEPEEEMETPATAPKRERTTKTKTGTIKSPKAKKESATKTKKESTAKTKKETSVTAKKAKKAKPATKNGKGNGAKKGTTAKATTKKSSKEAKSSKAAKSSKTVKSPSSSKAKKSTKADAVTEQTEVY